MKRILILSTIFLAFILIIGCEDFLEESPHTPSNAFYGTPSGALQGLYGVYSILQRGEDVERIEFYGTVSSCDAMAGGEAGGNDQPSMQFMMKFLCTPSDSYVGIYWNYMYQGIYRCNLLLESTEKEWSENDEERQNIRGEAIFLNRTEVKTK